MNQEEICGKSKLNSDFHIGFLCDVWTVGWGGVNVQLPRLICENCGIEIAVKKKTKVKASER